MKSLSTLKQIAARHKLANVKREKVQKGSEKLTQIPIQSVRRLQSP
jgi:hypothetical protein